MSAISLLNATSLYQRHEKKIILVVVIALSLYLVSIVAKLTWSILPAPESNIKNVNTNNSVTSSSSKNATVNVNSIAKLNLFGDAAVTEVTADDETEDDDVPETKLNLVLSGVVASSDENRGAAIIEYKNIQNTYGIGDKIEGTNVTLDQIKNDRVIIKNRLVKETLMLEGIDFEEANRNKAITAKSAQPVKTQRQNTREKAEAIRQARQEIAQQPASFADLIALAPHRVDGQLIGYRVSPGKKPALFNAVGLKNGDVVLALNGLDLTDLQQVQEALRELNEAETLQLEILRAGEFLSLDLEVPEDSGR